MGIAYYSATAKMHFSLRDPANGDLSGDAPDVLYHILK